MAADDLGRARREWERVYPLIDTLLSTGFIPGIKAALGARGLDVGEPREPLAPVTDDVAGRIAALLTALEEPATAV